MLFLNVNLLKPTSMFGSARSSSFDSANSGSAHERKYMNKLAIVNSDLNEDLENANSEHTYDSIDAINGGYLVPKNVKNCPPPC